MKSKDKNQSQTQTGEAADSWGSSVGARGNEQKTKKNSLKLEKARPTDIASRRNRPLPRLTRFIRRFWIWGLIILLIVWAWADPANLNMLLLGLGFVGQLLFAILFMVIQFGALFWFISRTRTVILRPGDAKAVTFDDYWGQPALVELVKQWIKLLAERDEFIKMGGEYINGLMLFGEPGTGKTMLAKAMAGEAGVAFMSVEGSGFRGMFWGMDTLRMMTFVNKARKLAREYGACIAYIDEIDAVGASRGGVMDGQARMAGRMPFMGGTGALTRLLYEMDGIGEPTFWERVRMKISTLLHKPPPKRNWHVLFMGSTNRPDVLDPALLRPGRFDQVIKVERPDRMGRREIIQGYITKIKHDPTQIDSKPHCGYGSSAAKADRIPRSWACCSTTLRHARSANLSCEHYPTLEWYSRFCPLRRYGRNLCSTSPPHRRSGHGIVSRAYSGQDFYGGVLDWCQQ